MEGVPQMEGLCLGKGTLALEFCLLQPMLFVTPSSTQTLMGTWLLPFQALSLQALAFVFQADYW